MISPDNGPRAWDRLVEADDPVTGSEFPPAHPDNEPDPPPAIAPASRLACLGAAWADLVGVLAVVTGCLAVTVITGRSVGLATVPWAAVAAVAWWTLSSVMSLRVSGATPGMAMVGVSFGQPVRGGRLVASVAAGAVASMLLGLPNLLGPAGSPVAIASGQKIVTLGTEVVTQGDV
jgi:hypothetical protein